MMRKIRAAAGRLWRAEVLSGCALLAEQIRLSTLLYASGTERKVLFFEWMVFGPVGEIFGAETVLEFFGAEYREETGGEGRICKYLCVHLAKRYDEETHALFYIGAQLDLEKSSELCFMTTFTPLAGGRRCASPVRYAAWPDASMTLMSYYGRGEAEMAGVGLFDELEDAEDADLDEGLEDESAA